MGDTIIIAKDEPKPAIAADLIVVAHEPIPKTEKIITEKTTITETKVD